MTLWRRFLRRGELERQLSRELQFHLDERVSTLRAEGLAEPEARRRALVESRAIPTRNTR